MRILTHVPAAADELLRRLLPADEIVPVPDDGPVGDSARGSVLLTTRFPWPNLAATIERDVAWVHVFGTGIDGFPLELVGERVLTCSRGASAVPIAEWCVAMMLAFEKRLPDTWIAAPPLRMYDESLGGLAGRIVGIVGVGSIGTALAARLAPFDTHVLGMRRTDRPCHGIEMVDQLGDLLARSDHVVLAVPATARTRAMLDAAALATMRRGAHVVNVARGSLIDDDALRGALDDGTVAMASLDVTEPEPLPAGHWMYAHPRVRLSPHCSSSSQHGMRALAQLFAENVERRRHGGELRGVIDRQEGY